MKKLVAGQMTARATALSSPAQADEISVMALGKANYPFWSVVKNGVEMAARHIGATVEYRSPETLDRVAMSQLVDGAVIRAPDGLVVSTPDADALDPSVQRAVAAGIPGISINSGSDVSKGLGALLHIGQDEEVTGHIVGEMLKEMGGKKGICINQKVGNVGLDLPCKGFTDGFGDVTALPTSNDPAEIQAKVTAALPAIDTVRALDAGTAGEPAVAAVAALCKGRGAIKVASYDLSASFPQSVAEGDAAFAIDRQQLLQGHLAAVFLALHADYGFMPGGNVASGPNLITADKAAQVVELSAQGIR